MFTSRENHSQKPSSHSSIPHTLVDMLQMKHADPRTLRLVSKLCLGWALWLLDRFSELEQHNPTFLNNAPWMGPGATSSRPHEVTTVWSMKWRLGESEDLKKLVVLVETLGRTFFLSFFVVQQYPKLELPLLLLALKKVSLLVCFPHQFHTLSCGNACQLCIG